MTRPVPEPFMLPSCREVTGRWCCWLVRNITLRGRICLGNHSLHAWINGRAGSRQTPHYKLVPPANHSPAQLWVNTPRSFTHKFIYKCALKFSEVHVPCGEPGKSRSNDICCKSVESIILVRDRIYFRYEVLGIFNGKFFNEFGCSGSTSASLQGTARRGMTTLKPRYETTFTRLPLFESILIRRS